MRKSRPKIVKTKRLADKPSAVVGCGNGIKKTGRKAVQGQKVKCWEVFSCEKRECPAYKLNKSECWLVAGKRGRDGIKGEILEWMELCINCKVFEANMDPVATRNTLKCAIRQCREYRSHQRKIEALVDSAGDSIVLKDKDYRYIVVNRACCKLLGTGIESIIGRTDFDLMPGPLAEKSRRSDEEALKSGSPIVTEEYRSGKWLHVVRRRVEDDGGNTIGIAVVIRDVTGSKQAEEKLLLLKEALESLPTGITVSDMNRKIIYANRAEAEIHGCAAEELVGEDARKFAPEEIWGLMTFENVHEKGVWRRESLNIRKGGEKFPVFLSSVAVKNTGGMPIGMVTVCEDISVRKQAEEKLMQRQEALRSVYNMATTLGESLKTVCDNIVLSLSQQLRTFCTLVLRREEVEMKVISCCMNGTTESEEARLISTYYPVHLHFDNAESQLKDSGTDIFESLPLKKLNLKSLISIPIRDSQERHVGAIIAMDREARRFSEDDIYLIKIFAQYIEFRIESDAMETRLRNAEKMEVIGKLAGGVAHEVRNPLNAITVLTEALFKDIRDNPDYQPLLFHIRDQVDRLSSLMRDMLVLGKPVERSNMRRESMHKICSAVIDMWAHSEFSGSHGLRLIGAEDHDDFFVFCESQRLQQVFYNLITNSAQHSPDGSEITINILKRGRSMGKVQVVDRGPGFQKEILSRIFEPFFSTRRGGTGLGLSIVKNIVETHGGSIVISNNEPSPGATVEVRLPVC